MRTTILLFGAIACAAIPLLAADKPSPTSPATTRSSPVTTVLENVPKVGFHTGKLSPLGGSLHACLEYLGDKPDYDELMAVGGGSFRRFYNRDDGGNVDIMYLGFEPVRRMVASAGWTWHHVPPERPAMLAELRASLAANRPVVGFGTLGGPPEACVIAGVGDEGNTLLGWSYFASGKSTGYHARTPWKPWTHTGLGLVVLDKKIPRPDPLEQLIATLRFAIDLSRSPRRATHPDHLSGLAVYDALAADLEADADFPNDPKVLRHRAMIIADQATMTHDRRHAAVYLRRAADALPTREPGAANLLRNAADLYDKVAANKSVWLWHDHWQNPKVLADLARRETRATIAAGTRQCQADETRAVELLEQALLLLSPVPEHAELKTPSPEQLSQGRKRPPEDNAFPNVMRAACDLLDLNPSGLSPDPGEWRVDPNHVLLMAATGESFCFPWLLRPGEKPLAFEFLPTQADARDRALRAMGLVAEVIPPTIDPQKELTPAQVVSLRNQVMASIAQRKMPTVLIVSGGTRAKQHDMLPKEDNYYLLVTAYEAHGDTLLGWKAIGGGSGVTFDPKKQVRLNDWPNTVRGAMVFTMPGSTRTPEQTVAVALEDGIAMLKRRELGPYHNNAAMHDAWAKAILDESLSADTDEAKRRRVDLLTPAIWDLAERRWYAQLFFTRAAEVFPPAKEELTAAGAEFMKIHDFMWQIDRLAGKDKDGHKWPNLASADTRKQIAQAITHAKAHDASALEKMQTALKKIHQAHPNLLKSQEE